MYDDNEGDSRVIDELRATIADLEDRNQELIEALAECAVREETREDAPTNDALMGEIRALVATIMQCHVTGHPHMARHLQTLSDKVNA